MKNLIYLTTVFAISIFMACSTQDSGQLAKDIDAQVDSLYTLSQKLEKKTFENPETSELVTGYFDENGKPVMMVFESYPDHVQFYYDQDLLYILHTIVGEEGIKNTETKYYYKDGRLFHYIVNNESKEISPEAEKASDELKAIEKEYLTALKSKGKATDNSGNASGSLAFLNDFVDKPSYDVAEDERLTSRLKNMISNEEDYGHLLSQLAYGDAIQKFNNVIVINGEARQVVDEEGNQVTFVSIIVADLVNNVLSIGMTDVEGNTSVFYTEAPGKKYPKQLVDWFTPDYRAKFKIKAQ
jgi:hypothetical protein